MRTLCSGSKGIGLVEILITMFVLAVGVVGVAGLNSVISRQSQENKAQAEAQAIAQNRIEELRNYTNDVDTLAEFDTLYAPISNGNSTAVSGINAAFTRTETIADSGEDKQVQVSVGWTNSEGDAQTVALNTRISYVSPRTVGDTALVAAASTIFAPTGRAYLGEGELPDGATPDSINDDGTALYEDGDDLKLVDCEDPEDEDTCGNIVLTLANACINDPCTAFAKIQGKVYINTEYGSGQFPAPSAMFLVASDAAYCARYYVRDDHVEKVGPSTAMNSITSTGDYRYFSYTCYVGGGWHGNIGLVFNGGGNNPSNGVRGCTGDPITTDASQSPRVAIRRAYRGLLYKIGPNDTRVQINGLDRLYSHGIEDGAQLAGHDFVLAKINDVDADCKNHAMKGAGSGSPAGTLFAGQPRDFFCLNNGYLDNFDTSTYGYDTVCPFDPTNPPSTKHQISGVVRLTATDTDPNDALAAGILVKTSDGITCTNPADATAPLAWAHNGTYYQASYSCGVYDWGTQAAPIGWTGSIQLTYNSASMSCTPSQLTYSTGVTADDSSGNDFTGCGVGAAAVWTGTVTRLGSGSSANKKLNSATLTGTGASAGINGTCVLGTGGLSYTCTTAQFTGTWSGNLTFVSAGGAICPVPIVTTRTYVQTNKSSGNYTQNLRIGRDRDGNGCP